MKGGLLEVESEEQQSIRRSLEDYVSQQEFPCVGAKSALARRSLEILVARDMRSAWDDIRIHDRLLQWSYAFKDDPTGLRSLAVAFAEPERLSEKRFEELMWERLQSLADKDVWRYQSYDERVSPDPSDPHFSLSFGGEAFFVVGLHPGASRPARRFNRPTLVFNLHSQFEALREEGKYHRMRKVILERDEKLAGSINPMLAEFGEASEARQYSGRIVEDDWQCPFRDRRQNNEATD